MTNPNDLNSWGPGHREASSAEMVRARRKEGTTTGEVASNHGGHRATAGSKAATRMAYFRVSTMLVTVVAAAMMAVLAGQKPAAAGVQVGDGVTIPPPPPGGWCGLIGCEPPPPPPPPPPTPPEPADTEAPLAPVIVDPAEGVYDNDGNFAVSGIAEANSTVELFEGSLLRGAIRADASGSWQVVLTGVAEGSHAYAATAKDAAGNVSTHSAPRVVTVDATGPTVNSITPPNQSTGVGRGISLTATFSEKMAASSIDASTFKLFKVRPGKSPLRIADVEVSLIADGLEATLDPFGTTPSVLAKHTKYKAIVAPGAQDLAGNTLGRPTSWTFTTK